MRLLFTICGRAGSKGIKNKNLRDFVGKPLMYIISWLIGSVITCVLLGFIKKDQR